MRKRPPRRWENDQPALLVGRKIEPRQIARFLLATLGFVILGVALFVGFSNYFLNQRVQADLRKMKKLAADYPALNYFPEMTRGLPEPLRRYFQYVFVDSIPRKNFVHITFRGQQREMETQTWFEVEGKAYYLTTRPVFLRFSTLKRNPVYWMKSRQRYWLSEGQSLRKLYASIDVARLEGQEESLDLLLCYLSHAPLFPLALLPGPFLRWEAMDSSTCRAIVQDENLEVQALFHFNSAGEITVMTAKRFLKTNEHSGKQEWTIYYRQYRLLNGHRVPTELEVLHKLPGGKLIWKYFKVDHIQYGFPGN